MQEGSGGWNSAAPEYLTDSEDFYLSELFHLITTSEERFARGHKATPEDLARDAYAGLYVLVTVEEMTPEQVASQRDFLCSLLHHTALLLEQHELKVFSGRVMEKIFQIDPNYLPMESDAETETTDEAPVLPKDNPLLKIPDL